MWQDVACQRVLGLLAAFFGLSLMLDENWEVCKGKGKGKGGLRLTVGAQMGESVEYVGGYS